MAITRITRQFAETLRTLRAQPAPRNSWEGIELARPRFGGETERVFVVPRDGAGPLAISDETFAQLRKLKLIEPVSGRIFRFGQSWVRRFCVSEAGRQYRLPDKRYWIDE